MIRRYVLATVLCLMALAVMPALAQHQFLPHRAATQPNSAPGSNATAAATPTPQYPPQGNDSTSSLGSFKVKIMPQFVPLFYNPGPPAIVCPGFDPATNILSSPSLSDPATLIGRSMEIPDDSSGDVNGVPVGIPSGIIQPTNVSESMLIPPPGFPCGGVSNCSSGPNTAEVHTEVESLRLVGSGAAVRAGQWYNNASTPTWPPHKISPGEVETEGTRTAGIIGSDFEKQLLQQTPLGRVGQPNDIALVAVFLASDDARWVTGEILAASGGL